MNKIECKLEELLKDINDYREERKRGFDRINNKLDRIEDSMNLTLEKVISYGESCNRLKVK